MKKIKFLICLVFTFVFLGGLSVFASEPSPADFKENFQIYRFLAYDVPESDFTYVYDNDEDGRSTQATYKGAEGDCPPSFGYSFRIMSDNASYKRVLPPGYVVMGRVWFNVILPIDDVTDLQSASVLLYDYPDGDFWSISGKEKVSDINFIEKIQTYSYGSEWRCYADVYYHNNTDVNADSRDFSFQFMFRLKTLFSAPSPYRVATFDIQVEDYYYGRADNPNIPAFNDFKDFDKSVKDYEALENDVMELFQSTFGDDLDLFSHLDFIIEDLSLTFIVCTDLINSFARVQFIDYLLYFSLALGFIAFTLNFFPSVVSKFKKGDD